MAKNSVRIRLKAYEHRILDASAEKIVQAAQAHGAKKIVGPVPLEQLLADRCRFPLRRK